MTVTSKAPASPAPGNPAIGTVPVDFDKRRHFKLTHSAMELIEEHTGVNMLNPVGGLLEVLAGLNMRRTTTLVWALLTDEDPGLTRERFVSLASTRQILENTPLALQAVRLAFPEIPDPEKKPEDPPKAKEQSASTPGSSDGPSPSTTSASIPPSSGG